MARPITYLDSPETRAHVLKAVSDLAELVGKTLGPGGRPILLEQEGKSPLSTKDGVTVARTFSAPNNIERVVADAAREVCERTVRIVGDGTTTAIVLASAIVAQGHQFLTKNPDYSPQRLCRELKDIFQHKIKSEVASLARPIRNIPADEAKIAIQHVAMVSSNHDEEIATAVADAIALVGDDGMVIVEEGAGAETKVEHKQGFPVTSGLGDLGPAAGSSFVNRKAYGDCVVEGSLVIMYDGDIENCETIIPLLQKTQMIMEQGQYVNHPVVVVAHRFGDMVLKMFAQNFRQGKLTVVPLITPRNGQANGRQSFLHDLAAYLGGQVFDAQGLPLTSGTPEMLGFAENVKIGLSDTVFLTEPDQESVEQRISDLKEQMDGVSEFDKERIRYRIGQLTGGIATIYAGGSTAFEAKERHARVVDAVSACRSAFDLGVVPGGGSTLVHVARSLNSDGPEWILKTALTRPFQQILHNVDSKLDIEEVGAHVGFDECKEGDTPSFFVYDALKRQLVEFWKSGIFDPAKVTVTALENALSVSQLLMTLGGVVAISMSDQEAQAKAMSGALVEAVNQNAFEQ